MQNMNSAAAEIAIRSGPKILLKCDRRQTGPKYPTIRIDDGYKSSFSLNHKFNHYDRRIGRSENTQIRSKSLYDCTASPSKTEYYGSQSQPAAAVIHPWIHRTAAAVIHRTAG
jgi:hypothetical protein